MKYAVATWTRLNRECQLAVITEQFNELFDRGNARLCHNMVSKNRKVGIAAHRRARQVR